MSLQGLYKAVGKKDSITRFIQYPGVEHGIQSLWFLFSSLGGTLIEIDLS